jgi:hypothetical protein
VLSISPSNKENCIKRVKAICDNFETSTESTIIEKEITDINSEFIVQTNNYFKTNSHKS